LYEAKESGRNRVVQLGTGLRNESTESARFQDVASGNQLIEQFLVSMVPASIAIEKVRGFVADHQAKIDKADKTSLRIRFAGASGFFRRQADRRVPMAMEIEFEQPEGEEKSVAANSRTRIRVRVLVHRRRDRRHKDAIDRARQLLASLKSYLMASEEEEA